MVRGRREGMGPVLILLIAAAVPAFGFGFLWRWSEARIPAAKAKEVAVVEPTPTAALTTPLLSVRRAPQTLATMSSEGALVSSLNAMAGSIDDTSCMVVELDGRPVFAKNGDLPVIPASNEKLLTGAVALEVLGADYTFKTSLLGTVANGTVNGNLYFLGGGDPLLSTAAYPPSVASDPPTDVTSMEGLVFSLAAAGVAHIQGDIVGDESRYDTERFDPTWDATTVQNVEAGPLGALLVNDATRQLGTKKRYPDPAVGAATDLLNLLKGAGITVSGRAVSGPTPAGTPEIASVTSVPLSTVVAEMLTTSDDNTAEMLMKEIAFKVNGAPGNRQGGIDAVKGTLTTWGIDPTPLNIIDGSGLDSGDTATCNVLLGVLLHQPLDGPLGAGLAVAGQTGTLATEFANTLIAGRFHAKTGTLNNSKALTGFITTPAGTLDVAMVLNAPAISKSYQPVWDQLAAALGPYPSGPAVDALQPR